MDLGFQPNISQLNNKSPLYILSVLMMMMMMMMMMIIAVGSLAMECLAAAC